MPFARWETFEQCTLEQKSLGHDEESAAKICGEIKDRAEKGLLYKAEPTGLQVLSKAGEPDIIVGGYASWDNVDDEGDQITVEAQSKALQRFFNQAPEWQSITVNHKEFKIAQPLLKFKAEDGSEYFSHVNEKGTYLISKLRNDNLKTTQNFRDLARKGDLNGYSITGLPLQKAVDNPKKVLDIEYHSVTLTQKGYMKPINPMSRDVKVLAKSEKCECDTTMCGGACCTFITVPLQIDTPDVKAYLTLHGLENKSDGKGGLYVKMPVPCTAFDADSKLCKAHDERPNICRIYPQTESPFIEKAKCSLLQKKQNTLKKASLNSEKPLDVESILRKHGFKGVSQ